MMAVAVGLEALTLSLVAPVSSLILGKDSEQLSRFLPSFLAALEPSRLILVVLGAGVCLIAFKNLYVGAQIRWQYRFVASAKAAISSRMLERYLKAPYSFHLSRNSAELIRNVVNEVNELELRILIPWMLLLSEVLVCAGLITVLLFLTPVNTLAVAILLLLAGVGYVSLTRGILSRWGEIRLASEELRIRSVQQCLGGIKEVKLLGLENPSLQIYEEFNRNSARAFAVQAFFANIPRLLLEFVALSSVLLVVVISVVRAQPVEEMITGMGLLAVAAFRLLPSANRIISAASSLRFGSASLKTVSSELENSTIPIPDQEGASEPEVPDFSFSETIEIEDLTFAYEGGGRPVLEKISLKIPHNAFVGIVGESGSGKSTLVDILLGLLTPLEGRVLVDGVDIRENLRGWQDRLAYVPQQIYLADTTIRENIAFGLDVEEIDDQRIREVLRLAHIEDFVDSLPDGLETEVGERGVRLSGGQCQRIGIARALYRDPEVVVFDEATSALDDESQDKVMEAIRDLKGLRTIIMISHRMSTIDHCDRIFQLK